MSFAAPLSAGCRGKCVHGSSRTHYSAQVSDHYDSEQNKTHTFSKREQNLFLPAISVLPLCSTAVSTPCHAGRGLECHQKSKVCQSANMPRGLVQVAGSERRVISHPGSPPSQTILEIRIQRGGISIQGPAVWAIPGSPHIYTMHECGSLPSATDGNPQNQLRRLAHSGPVADGFNIAQDPSPQPLRLPGTQGQLLPRVYCHTANGFCSWVQLSTVINTETVSTERAMTIQRHAASFKEGTAHPLKAFQRMLVLMAVASPVLQLGLLHMQPIPFWQKQRVPSIAWRHGRHRVTVIWACVSALAHWRDPFWLSRQTKEGCHDRHF